MKSKLKTFGVFLISLLMLFTFVGCNKSITGDRVVVRDPSDTNDFRMDTPVDLNVALSWNQDWYPSGVTHDKNPIYSLYKSAINVNVINKIALPWDGYEQSIANGMIDGDLPDAFFATQKMVDELIRNDYIEDMKPYYDLWATEELKTSLEYNESRNFSYVTRKDKAGKEKVYGIPSVADDSNRPVVWARKDWIANINSKALPSGKTIYDTVNGKRFNAEGAKSLNEFWDLAEAFALEDPDGDGRKNTFGLTISKNLDDLILPIFSAYGAYPDAIRKQSDGTWKNLLLEPEVKTALTKLNEMVEKNVISKDYINWDSQSALQKTTSEAGMALGVGYTPLWPLMDSVTKDTTNKVDWVAQPMYGADGNIIVPARKLNASGYYVVKKGYSHPEVVIKMLNNMASSDSTSDWNKGWVEAQKNPSHANNLINWLPIRMDKSTVNFERTTVFNDAIDNATDGVYDTSKIEAKDMPSFNQVTDYIANKTPSNWGMYKTFIEGMPVCKLYDNNENKGIYSDWNYERTKTMKSSRGQALETMSNEVRLKIISGVLKLSDGAWEAFVSDYKKGGGDQILLEMKQSGY